MHPAASISASIDHPLFSRRWPFRQPGKLLVVIELALGGRRLPRRVIHRAHLDDLLAGHSDGLTVDGVTAVGAEEAGDVLAGISFLSIGLGCPCGGEHVMGMG